MKNPNPSRPWLDKSLSPDVRAQHVVDAMSDDEKFAWLCGDMAIPIGDQSMPEGAIGSAGYFPAIPRLGIPAIQQSDASLGVGNLSNVRPGDNATALPSSLALGASFDPDIAYATGQVIGKEAHCKGFNVQLAGGANLIREPRGGRNFEYVAEDPLLTGRIAGQSIAGIQSEHVVSTVKHFAMNAQETGRVLANATIKEAAARESDLLAFQIALETGAPGAVMPGYNLMNGTYATENTYLLNDLLKGDWRFPGWVMSDWGATHSTEDAVLAGLDVQSGANLDSHRFFDEPLKAAVRDGRISSARIDDMVRRQLRSLFAVGAIDNPAIPGTPIDYDAHRMIVRQAAEAGSVLLRNERDVLPLSLGLARILVVGGHADIGVLSGGGSSSVTPTGSTALPGIDMMGMALARVYQPTPPLDAIRAQSSARQVDFLDGKDIEMAAAAARIADAVIVFVEAWSTESMDAESLALDGAQDALVTRLAASHPNVIVVLQTGRPISMPWLDNVAAVLCAWFPGSGGADAIAGLLFGRVNPSGRLPLTFPKSLQQLPRVAHTDPTTTTSNPGMPLKGDVFSVSYDIEGSDVGYRWYEREGLVPLFPFGFGLSYTDFTHGEVRCDAIDGQLAVALTVVNSGNRHGIETVQLYVGRNGPQGYPRRLAAFARVALAPGASTAVRLVADPRIIAGFEVEARQFLIGAADYTISLGRHARDSYWETVHRFEATPVASLEPTTSYR